MVEDLRGLENARSEQMEDWVVRMTGGGLDPLVIASQNGPWAYGLRSFLRADPDVILVGEMRDRETASIGVEASLT